MANKVIKFYRGLSSAYNPTTHADGIFFTTDTHKIMMNGAEYGGDSNKKVADVALNVQKNGIVISYTDATSTTLLFGKATTAIDGLMSKEDKSKLDSLNPSTIGVYDSALDSNLATVEKIGGIEVGTTVADLEGKNYNEILDDLIFPTINPRFTNPSASIKLRSNYPNVQEIGAVGPKILNFEVGFNPGEIVLAGKKQANRAGAQDTDASVVVYGADKSSTLPARVIEGTMSYFYRAYYAQGPQPKDSKGNNYDSPLAAGYVDSTGVIVTGVRPAYSGLISTNVVTQDVIKGMTKIISKKKTVKVSGPISEQYICFAAPAGWSVSNIKDSNNFDVTSSYTTSTVSVTCEDNSVVNYKVYISGKMTQPNTYYVNFN